MDFIYSDGGRSKYFKASNVGDCVTRAICNATGLDYRFVYDRLKQLAKLEKTKSHYHGKRSSVRDGVFKETWKLFLDEIDWVRVKTMDMGSSKRVHLRDGELPSEGTYIVQVSRHLTCVRDNSIVDTYDCSRDGDRMVYGYYRPMTDEEIAAKRAAEATAASEAEEKEKTKEEAKRKAQERRLAEKKIKERYAKKMAPYLRKIRAFERQMKKELADLSV